MELSKELMLETNLFYFSISSKISFWFDRKKYRH